MVDPAVSEELLQTEVSRLVRMMEAQAEQLRDPAFCKIDNGWNCRLGSWRCWPTIAAKR